MRHASFLLAGLLLFTVAGPAEASPCVKTTRVEFHTDLGEATISGVFKTLESVSKRNHQHREAIRVKKCALIKLTGTKSWKEASKALPAAAAANPEVLSLIRKLRQSIPPHKKYVALVEEAKVAKRKYDALIEVAVPDSRTQRYLQNIERLRGYVSDLNKTTKHMAGMRKRLTGIIKASGG